MKGRALVYGATGKAGADIVRQLVAEGVDVVLAGRDQGRVATIAGASDRPYRAFPVALGAVIDEALADVDVVLNAAGPFLETASPMMAACIRTRTHYLDLAGEWPVFAEAQDLSSAATAAGVMLTPGAGFTVVASDCLLALAAKARPDAVKLRLAVSRPDAVSRATVRSLSALIGPDIYVRRDGILVPQPVGRLSRDVDFGEGPRETTAVCWPDIITAQFTTGIGNIETYAESDWIQRSLHRVSASASALLSRRASRALSDVVSLAWPHSANQRGDFVVVVEAVDRWRRATPFRMRLGDGHQVSIVTACAMVKRVLEGDWAPGFRSPASLYGPQFIFDLGCARVEDVRDLTLAVS